jgi:hypothetical protein
VPRGLDLVVRAHELRFRYPSAVGASGNATPKNLRPDHQRKVRS